MFQKSRLLHMQQKASKYGKGLIKTKQFWVFFNPFPHTTILQQMTLNIFCQKVEKLYNWMDNLWLKVENIVSKGETCLLQRRQKEGKGLKSIYGINSFIYRATHNLYQLVKRHQKQAAQADETSDQLNQVCFCGILTIFFFSFFIDCNVRFILQKTIFKL